MARTLAHLKTEVNEALAKAKITNHASEAEWLLAMTLNRSWGQLAAHPQQTISIEDCEKIQKVLERRKQGEPLAYIFSQQEFYSLKFYVDSRVLIPRSETEFLVDEALKAIGKNNQIRVVDIGCGSGCIGLTVAKYRPKAEVLLIDKSPDALDVAKENYRRLGLNSKVEFMLKEITDSSLPLPDPWSPAHIILANPPYIARNDVRIDWQVARYEPELALYAEEEGLDWIHKWLLWSYHNLIPNGVGIFEIGAGQADRTRKLIESVGLSFAEAIKDYQGIERVVKFRKVT